MPGLLKLEISHISLHNQIPGRAYPNRWDGIRNKHCSKEKASVYRYRILSVHSLSLDDGVLLRVVLGLGLG